jgi:putative transcriptional regulator
MTAMSKLGDDLIQAMTEALAYAKGESPAVIHAPIAPWEVREKAHLTQVQMAPLMGMSLSGYRKWEQGQRRVCGPAATLLLLLQKEPDVVKRALLS